MKTYQKIILLILMVLPLVTAISSYGNPRMHKGIASYDDKISPQIIELAKCYSSLKLIGKGISFGQYYETFLTLGLDHECQQQITLSEDKTLWYIPVKDDLTDTDGDGFTDVEETNEKTDPQDYGDYPWWIDIDGDGYTNDHELSVASDPLDLAITPDWKDTDHDGYGDVFETEHQSDPNDAESVPKITAITPTTGSPAPESKGIGWKIYLLIGLGILLIIIITSYLIYSRKEE